MVWPCLKVFWFSKDNSKGGGGGEWKKEENVNRRRGEKTISKSGQGWNLSAQLGQMKTGQDGKKLLRSHLTMQDYGID